MSNELIGNFSNGEGLVGNLGNAGSGTNNYNDLVNKPSINGVTLAGNKSLTDLGINIPTKVSQLQNDSHYVQQSAIPTKTSQLQNDSGFAYTANLATVALTGSYNNLSDKPTIPAAQVNSDWNSNSGVSQILNKPNLAAVATSGDYDDLTNKPTIPAAQVNSDWNSNSGVSQILNKPNLAAVATSGDYDDLTNKPTIPAAQVNSDWNSNSGVSEILNKPTIPTNSDFSLSGLSDTTITTPLNNQILTYDGGKWKNKSDFITLTPDNSGVTFSNVGGSKIGNQVVLSATVNFSGSQNQWTTLGTINITPSQDPRTVLTRNAYGDVCGIIRIQSNGTVSAFTIMAVSGNMSFCICYTT